MGDSVQRFEKRFAAYVGAEYCIALCNGTATLHTALLALGVKPGDRVAVPPLTMSATTIAVLQAGAVPVFVDVDPETWLMGRTLDEQVMGRAAPYIDVSLYGLWARTGGAGIDDAAQTFRRHGNAAFTSWSFQSSKILSCGEGGALCTNDPHLAKEAREISSLGYKLAADQPRIDSSIIRSPTYQRHHRAVSWNYRLAPLLAEHLLSQDWDALKETRQRCAALYAEAIKGCDWLQAQHVPEGWSHDYWTYAVAIDEQELKWADSLTNVEPASFWEHFARTIVKHGGERPYAAWLPFYQEPCVLPVRLTGSVGICPVAEDLQPRLLQFQTNDFDSATRNATALHRAIQDLS
jgi:perosamine synthetase